MDSDAFEAIISLLRGNRFHDVVRLLTELLHKHEKNPHKYIAILTMRIYYNIQLNANQDVVADLNLVNSPYSEKWLYETYPEKYGDKKGTMCPFSLFLIHAYYPHLVGSAYIALDRLYVILENLEQQLSESSQEIISRDVLLSRILCVGLLIGCIFSAQDRPKEAIEVLMGLNLKYLREDPITNLVLAINYHELGDVEAARKYIEIAARSHPQMSNFYSGLSFMIENDFENAKKQFEIAKETINSTDLDTDFTTSYIETVLANNIAVSMFYMDEYYTAEQISDSYRDIFQLQNARLFRGMVWNMSVLKGLLVDDQK